MQENIRLTQLSHGAGCGCKISPSTLEKIIKSDNSQVNPALLVGTNTKDDAAVYDIGDGRALISTTDFFMPIVDDPFDFGVIASVNALSDVYAMGGKPLMAIAILGWPVDKVDPSLATQVMEGARYICKEAGIDVAGGHSIDNPEPIFGLAVTGILEKKNLKRNNTAKSGDLLYLTKPLGVGLITTAHKKGLALPADLEEAVSSMKKLNSIGAFIGEMDFVNAVTDITGFGLLGHLVEVCEGSGVSSEINFEDLPKFNNIDYYINSKTEPGGTTRNWESFKNKIGPIEEKQISLLADPQTSGGLLISVDESKRSEFEERMFSENQEFTCIGRVIPKNQYAVMIC